MSGLRKKTVDGSAVYASDIEIQAEKQYEVLIYYHNNASEESNMKENNYVGVARDTRISSMFPLTLKRGERGGVVAKISSTTTDPETVWDGAYITAAEDMTLHYVTASAKIYNGFDANGSVLSTNLFSEQGTLLGTTQLNGLVLGGGDFSGMVLYTIATKAVE